MSSGKWPCNFSHFIFIAIDSFFCFLQLIIEQVTTAKEVSASGKVVLIPSTAQEYLSLQAKQIHGTAGMPHRCRSLAHPVHGL
jgi:hypothetical protein